MHTRADIPALSNAYAMALRHGARDEGIAIAAEMMLAEEMAAPDFMRLVLGRLAEQDIGDQLVAAFAAGNIGGLATELGKMFEAEARTICELYARAEN